MQSKEIENKQYLQRGHGGREYPDTTTPYRYMRALMVYGLTELGKLDEKEPITAISSLM